jgi:hypothetical protein
MRGLPDMEEAKWVDSRDARCKTLRVHSYFLRISIQKQSLVAGERLERSWPVFGSGNTRKGAVGGGSMEFSQERRTKRPPQGGRYKSNCKLRIGRGRCHTATPSSTTCKANSYRSSLSLRGSSLAEFRVRVGRLFTFLFDFRFPVLRFPFVLSLFWRRMLSSC